MINLAVLGLYLLIGFILKRTGKCPDNTAQVLNLYVIYAALPGVIFSKVPALEFSTDLLIPVVIPWILLAFSAVFIWLLGRAFKWPREVVGALLICVPLGNTSFFGFPMIEAFTAVMLLSTAYCTTSLAPFWSRNLLDHCYRFVP